MDLVDKIVATGKSLGLEGDRLVEFVQKKEEEAIAREERKLERELKNLSWSIR